MNKMYMKRYVIQLETVGPLFIGSGEQFLNREYMTSGGFVYFPNHRELLKVMDGAQKEAYLQHMKTDNSLKVYFDNNATQGLVGVLKQSYKLPVSKLPMMDKTRTIEMFIRDGLDRPYIPGSSIKGALRSAIEKIVPKLQNLPQNQQLGFWQQLSVSDTVPFDPSENFRIVAKPMGKGKSTPLFRECVDIGKTFKIEVTSKSEQMSTLIENVTGDIFIGGGSGINTKAWKTQFTNGKPFPPNNHVFIGEDMFDMGKCKLNIESEVLL
jgi:CRISPR-associated protein Csm5